MKMYFERHLLNRGVTKSDVLADLADAFLEREGVDYAIHDLEDFYEREDVGFEVRENEYLTVEADNVAVTYDLSDGKTVAHPQTLHEPDPQDLSPEDRALEDHVKRYFPTAVERREMSITGAPGPE